MTKRKQYVPPPRSVECQTCGHIERVAYESTIWSITENCIKCAPVKADFPVLYEWIMAVVEKNKMTSSDVQDIVKERLNSTREYY